MSYPLITERLSIEPLSENDLSEFISYRQDPDVARYQGWDISFSKPDAINLLNSQKDITVPSTGKWLQLAIHNLKSGELMGDLALHRLENQECAFEIGFTISSKNQGNGIAKEAVARLISFLFEEVGAKIVIATCDDRNMSAARLLISLGFEQISEKSWTENFKNELVKVNFYQKVQP
jgi:RimJ/RimL family protein N-acetyltransferase